MRLLLPAATFIATICLTLGGCHSANALLPGLRSTPVTRITLARARQALQQATPCCTRFADLSYQKKLPWRPKPFRLGPGSPVLNMAGTHSYFLAFSLPTDLKLPYRVGLKSQINGQWLKESYLFAPTIVLLDSTFQTLATKDVKLCEYMGWNNSSSGAFGSIAVTSAKARYLVLYSSPQQQVGVTYWEQSTPLSFALDTPIGMTSQAVLKYRMAPTVPCG